MIWAWIKAWEVREWLTLGAAAVAAFVSVAVYRGNARRLAAAEAAKWSIEIRPELSTDDGFLIAEIHLQDYSINRFVLTGIAARNISLGAYG